MEKRPRAGVVIKTVVYQMPAKVLYLFGQDINLDAPAKITYVKLIFLSIPQI